MSQSVEGVIEADLVAAAVRAVMATRTEWTGTASDPPRPRRRASASPSQRPGRMALGRRQAGCAGRGPVRFTSLPPRAKRPRTMPGRDRPHRPHRPRPRLNPIPPTASRRPACGRLPIMRTVQRAATFRPSAPWSASSEAAPGNGLAAKRTPTAAGHAPRVPKATFSTKSAQSGRRTRLFVSALLRGSAQNGQGGYLD